MTSPLAPLIAELQRVHEQIAQTDRACAAYVDAIPEEQRASARNLLHYLALRCHDLRHIQPLLASHGLSSLGRTESHVRDGVESVLRVLGMLNGGGAITIDDSPPLSKQQGDVLLEAHTDSLLGPPPPGRSVRIMVTMPGEAASDYQLIRELVASGMDCMRINCAHDDEAAWERMIDHLQRARRDLQRPCRLSMDIGGPKLRTGPLCPGPAVIKIKPKRDALGAVVRPATVALVAAGRAHPVDLPIDAVLTLDGDLPPGLEPGDTIELCDARGRLRRLVVRTDRHDIVIVECDRTAYVINGSPLTFATANDTLVRSIVGVPATADPLTLRKGDALILTSDAQPGVPAIRDDAGRVLVPATIGMTLPEAFRDVQPGQSIWFDDGKIGGMVRAVTPTEIQVTITQAKPDGSRLGAGKGINLPDTRLRLSALTPKDVDDLKFITKHADLIGYSFVRHAEDIHLLQDHLAALDARRIGIVLKVETQHAFAELPRLLLACMRTGRFGVMIARGDLAVECGFERMAEIQEEILWICEAAHTPVIWATQVLESLAKTGQPSRAEVSDAAMAERAECVMLNKGPYIRDAAMTLDNILRRMQAHQTKTRAMLRPLHLAHAALSDLRHAETTGS